MRTIATGSATRWAALLLAGALLAACSGGANGLPPAGAGAGGGAAPARMAAAAKHRIAVRVRVRIPRRSRAHAARAEHPSTISPLTQSVAIAVDGGAAQVFGTTPSSPGCGIGASGTTCTFTVQALLGTDTFDVTTYSGTGASGTPLDSGVATVAIAKGTANSVAVSLGPVVSTTANSGAGSLRYAVGSANAGDTILFLLPAGDTIVLDSAITISTTLSLAGPGAANLSISGGSANQLFVVTGNATISGLTITQGHAATPNVPGGAIHNTGSLTLVNDTIGNSSSVVASVRSHRAQRRLPSLRLHPHCTDTYYEGGAIYNDGVLTMSGNTFASNVVLSTVASCIFGEGGAIYNDIDGSLSSTGDTFTSNSAYSGGAIYNVGIGAVTFTNDTFAANTGCNEASGCATSGCTTMSCTSFATGSGGAIFDDGSGIVVVGSTFKNNVVGGASNASHGDGGALWLAGGTPSVTTSTFTGNEAGGGAAVCSEGFGGAIFAIVPVVVDGDTFSNNVASGDAGGIGGAIDAEDGVQGAGVTFTSNAASSTGSACEPNASAFGGAVADLTGGQVTFAGSAFTGNSATGNQTGTGGALVFQTGAFSDDTFTSNAAVGTGLNGATLVSAIGGALYSITALKLSDSAFKFNAVTIGTTNADEAFGGAVASEGSVVSSGNAYTSNSANALTGGTGAAIGGAFSALGGTVSSVGETFASNTATSPGVAAAGGAYLSVTSFSMAGATFSGNAVSGDTALGGGFVGADGTISNSTFTSNASSSSSSAGQGVGGGAYAEAHTTVTGSTISQNSATTAGGGLYFTGTSDVENAKIAGNTVSAAAASGEGGGGIYADGTTIESSTIANNSVTVSGAGSSGGGGILNGGGLTLDASTVSGNAVLGSAPGSGGGGIYNTAAATMTNSTISGNTSSGNGGGIDVAANDSVILANITMYQNTASGIGGNIDNLYAMTLLNSIVAGGSATTGPDIDNSGTLTSQDYNIIQTPVAGTAIAGTFAHDQTANPFLFALADNGGPTFTNAEQVTSPGIAKIPFTGGTCGNATALATDQRGYSRGTGGTCDIGAFELSGTPTSIRHRVPHRIGSVRERDLLPHLHPIVLPKLHPIALPELH